MVSIRPDFDDIQGRLGTIRLFLRTIHLKTAEKYPHSFYDEIRTKGESLKMGHIIKVNQVQKKFQQTTALDQISFHVSEGEIFGMLGPSGAGKTTMIKLMTGELGKTAGDLEVLGKNPDAFHRSSYKAQIGVLSDNSALYDRLSVLDNLKLFCKLYEKPLSRIDEVLELVNMWGEQKKIVSKLSKGMRQRVLLAKSFIHQPKLLFLDEPTSALDPGNTAHIHRSLRKLNEEGTTIFLNTHDMQEAADLCDRVAFLHQGKIQELDRPSALRYKYSSHAFHITTFAEEELVIENTPDNAAEVAQLIADGAVKEMHTDNPTLGDIFLNITGKELV